jgi:aromatic-amino-acid transaminase
LSVGVYQDEQGRTPVLASVKRAEKAIIDAQDSKTYVAIAGNAGFNRGVGGSRLYGGEPSGAQGRPRRDGAERRAAAGGLSIAGHLLSRAKPGAKVYLSDPSWPNHFPLLKARGLTLENVSVLRLQEPPRRLRSMTAKLETGERGRGRADPRLLPQPVRRGSLEGPVAGFAALLRAARASCRSSTSRIKA